ncbi:MAG: TniQ family protein, partial [Rhodobacteraceae bacterium]|nr:TniQ family protein [Paracoccaceae bacterium]
MKRQLPVTFPPVTDELLSSWINRHDAFCAVPPLVLLRHYLPDTASLRATDLGLITHQAIHLAGLFSTEPIILQRMTFGNVTHSARKFIATKPTQHCTNCNQGGTELTSVLRSQLLGWRITCPQCGSQFSNSDRCEHPSLFQKYRVAAIRGEKLLDDEIER